MRLLDPRFKENKLHYILQCCLVTLIMFVLLMGLRAIANAAIIASLGASAFIAFAMPHIKAARPRYLIGGYTVGILMGILFSLLSHWEIALENELLAYPYPYFCAAMAVGASVFTMVLCDVEHPPAAGVALGLVLGPCAPRSVITIALGIITLAWVKHFIKPVLIDLL